MSDVSVKVHAVYDPDFQPMELVMRAYEADVAQNEHQQIVIAVVRDHGHTSAMGFSIYKDGTKDEMNFAVLDRAVKTLLWARGGYKIVVCGSKPVYAYFRDAYGVGGSRDFDREFMARVYERPFEVEYIENIEDAPAEKESACAVGRHTDGCRIGFDAGASDRKVSAVIDGEVVFSEEVVWSPKTAADPDYHYQGILESMKTAAGHMPRVDAIGVSTAGVCIAGRIMVASLFRGLSDADFEKRAKGIYTDVAKMIGAEIPIEVANDGDVAALAGAMELNADGILGISMGSSEAGGYVDLNGNITGWLNELAFAPVDFNADAAADEWSGDRGCGVKYFSQEAVVRLAFYAGIAPDTDMSPAEQLKVIQSLMAQGDERARGIYETIGVYFGYTLAYYARFYEIRHVLIMGRVTSGEGGALLLGKAQEVLDTEFPQLSSKVRLHLPDESARRIGQSVAAASLPALH